jgi:hypothetical protein
MDRIMVRKKRIATTPEAPMPSESAKFEEFNFFNYTFPRIACSI